MQITEKQLQKMITKAVEAKLNESRNLNDVKKKYKKAYKFFNSVLMSSTFEDYWENVFLPAIQGEDVDDDELDSAFEWLNMYL